jgi:hypothetical protein
MPKLLLKLLLLYNKSLMELMRRYVFRNITNISSPIQHLPT